MIYLKVNYTNEIPDEAFESGTYNDNKSMTISLATGDANVPGTLKNPNTGVKLYIIILLIILISSGIPYIILKKKQYTKYIFLIIGINIIIPISIYALCKYDINITTNIKIDKPIACGFVAEFQNIITSYYMKEDSSDVVDGKQVI